jgi:hypothetical protein
LIARPAGHAPAANDEKHEQAEPHKHQQIAVILWLVKRDLNPRVSPLANHFRIDVFSRQRHPEFFGRAVRFRFCRLTLLRRGFGLFRRRLHQGRLDKLTVRDRAIDIDRLHFVCADLGVERCEVDLLPLARNTLRREHGQQQQQQTKNPCPRDPRPQARLGFVLIGSWRRSYRSWRHGETEGQNDKERESDKWQKASDHSSRRAAQRRDRRKPPLASKGLPAHGAAIPSIHS